METYIDLITGRELPYNDDEYVRQAVEKLLVERGYSKENVTVDAERCLEVDGCQVGVRADLMITLGQRVAMVLRCARGSLVSREKEIVAAARLISDPWPLFAVVANGEDAELISVDTGKVLAEGLEAIPSLYELQKELDAAPPRHPEEKDLQKASRVYAAYSFIQCPGQCTV